MARKRWKIVLADEIYSIKCIPYPPGKGPDDPECEYLEYVEIARVTLPAMGESRSYDWLAKQIEAGVYPQGSVIDYIGDVES